MKNELLKLVEAEEKFQFEQQLEKEELNGFIKVLRHDVANFQAATKQFINTPEYHQKLQAASENIEKQLEKFKEKQLKHFDALLEQELQLSKDLDIVVSRLHTFEVPTRTFETRADSSATRARSVSASSKRPIRNAMDGVEDIVEEEAENINPDDYDDNQQEAARANQSSALVALEKKMKQIKHQIDVVNSEIIKNGGKLCAWEQEDHSTFLKLRTKFKNNTSSPEFVAECVNKLPYLSELEVEEHIEKYEKFVELEEQKKTLMQEYKESKNEHKKLTVAKIEEEDKLKEKTAKKVKIPAEMSQEERQTIKFRIKQWKENRPLTTIIDNRLPDPKVKTEEQKAQEKMLRDAAIRQLQEYKEKREVSRQRKKENEERQSSLQRKKMNALDSLRLKEREEKSFQKKMQLLTQQRFKQFEQERRRRVINEANGSNKYDYVEPKLTEETKVTQNRKREKFDPRFDQIKPANTFGGNLNHLIRAVPSWRQGL